MLSNLTDNLIQTNYSASNGSSIRPGVTEARCEEWTSMQHALYHVGNAFIVLSFIVPPKFNLHTLCLRIVIAVGSVFLVLYGALAVCGLDISVWNALFAVINASWAIKILYTLRPIKLDPEVNEFYKLLQPFGVSKHEFCALCERVGRIIERPAGSKYAIENETNAGSHLSILLSGVMRVSCDGIPIHLIEATEFVDSPEYERCLHLNRAKSQSTVARRQSKRSDREGMVSEGENTAQYQVTITAMRNVRILVLNIRRLNMFMRAHVQFEAVMHNLIGRDIAQKMQKMQQYILHQQRLPSNLTSAADASSSLLRAKEAVNCSVTNLDEKNALLRRVNAVAGSVRSIQQDGFMTRSAGPKGSQTALSRAMNQIGQRLLANRHYSGGRHESAGSDDDAETELQNNARPLQSPFVTASDALES